MAVLQILLQTSHYVIHKKIETVCDASQYVLTDVPQRGVVITVLRVDNKLIDGSTVIDRYATYVLLVFIHTIICFLKLTNGKLTVC